VIFSPNNPKHPRHPDQAVSFERYATSGQGVFMDGVNDRDEFLECYWKLYRSLALTNTSRQNLMRDFFSLIGFKKTQFKRDPNIEVAGDKSGFIGYLTSGKGT
jgi:hypothetical protein